MWFPTDFFSVIISSLDATTPSVQKFGRLTNHGVGQVQNAKMKVRDLKGPVLCLFATKTISSGQEVLYDYGIKNPPWIQKKGKIQEMV